MVPSARRSIPTPPTQLLDELGLDKRRDDGTRLLPDGRPMEIVVEASGEDNEQSDVLEIVADQWAQIGFKISPKPPTGRSCAAASMPAVP